mmetsp:Transcript_33193/g.53913  ORF Transcript_33193/g.53913 Transcript_33193/m.53913 type:complete len:361 (-) Transcript_33193:272-1354(-)
MASTNNPVDSSAEFVKLINKGFADSKTPEGKAISVAFLGSKGSFTDVAAQKFFKKAGLKTTAVGMPSFEGVFKSVADGSSQAGMVPIESTWSGSFARCLDCLLKYQKVNIVGEISVIDSHCLSALPGTKAEDIEAIHSHPDMFAQCSGFIEKLSKTPVEKVSEFDSATAAAVVKRTGKATHGAICSPEAAKLHGLQVLKSSLANDTNSASRYIVVAAVAAVNDKVTDAKDGSIGAMITQAANGGESVRTLNGGSQTSTLKCTLAITMHNEAQGLFKVLSCFALRGMNVTKLDSRPSSSALGTVLQDTVHWEYVFFLDFEPKDENAIDVVVANVGEFCSSLRILGVYQANLKSSTVQLRNS